MSKLADLSKARQTKLDEADAAYKAKQRVAQVSARADYDATSEACEAEFHAGLDEAITEQEQIHQASAAARSTLQSKATQLAAELEALSVQLSLDRLALEVQRYQASIRKAVLDNPSRAERPEHQTLALWFGRSSSAQCAVGDEKYALYRHIVQNDLTKPDDIEAACLELLQPYFDSGLLNGHVEARAKVMGSGSGATYMIDLSISL